MPYQRAESFPVRLGQDVVAQDPGGQRVHPVAGHRDQRRECVAITVLGPLDEVPHRRSLNRRTELVRSHPMSRLTVRNVHGAVRIDAPAPRA